MGPPFLWSCLATFTFLICKFFVYISYLPFFNFSQLNLESAAEREKAVEDIYGQREFTKLVVTLWVMRDF